MCEGILLLIGWIELALVLVPAFSYQLSSMWAVLVPAFSYQLSSMQPIRSRIASHTLLESVKILFQPPFMAQSDDRFVRETRVTVLQFLS